VKALGDITPEQRARVRKVVLPDET
jgi:hypothetical protein